MSDAIDMTPRDPGLNEVAAPSLPEPITDAVSGLSDSDRCIFELFFRHGLDSTELAEVLGVSLGSAQASVHRVRQTIERSITKQHASSASRQVSGRNEGAEVPRGLKGKSPLPFTDRTPGQFESCKKREERQILGSIAWPRTPANFTPAPAHLRERTLRLIQLLTPATDGLDRRSSTSSEMPDR